MLQILAEVLVSSREVARRVHFGCVCIKIILVRLLEPIGRNPFEKCFEVSCVVGDIKILEHDTMLAER